MRRGDEQQLPDNPERFDEYLCVLGSEGFNSGTHCWDVDVGDSDVWALGVMTESAQRKGDVFANSGVWAIGYGDGKYNARSASKYETITNMRRVYVKPKRIRVQLDWDRGQVSFSNLGYSEHLHTFKHKFTERVFPYFGSPLGIVPLETFVGMR